MGTQGESTDHEMLAPDSSPIHLDFLGKSGLNHAIDRPGDFLLQSKECILESCLLLAWVGSKIIGDTSKSH